MAEPTKQIPQILQEQMFFVDMADSITPKDGVNRQTSGVSKAVLAEIETGNLELFYRKGNQIIEMCVTPCALGGGRLWLVCRECGERKGKLYRPLFATEYLCRDCHGLVYRSKYKAMTICEILAMTQAVDMWIHATRRYFEG